MAELGHIFDIRVDARFVTLFIIGLPINGPHSTPEGSQRNGRGGGVGTAVQTNKTQQSLDKKISPVPGEILGPGYT